MCRQLQGEVPEQQFNTWIRPLQAVEEPGVLRLLAPNRFVVDWVREHYLARISEVAIRAAGDDDPAGDAGHGAQQEGAGERASVRCLPRRVRAAPSLVRALIANTPSTILWRARAISWPGPPPRQVAENPGTAYNPLFIYGGVGLGKTHLMHAVGNAIRERRPDATVAYVHSERFVGDMVRALQHNTINEFKRAYRSLDALLIDDIQFFAGKERSQEEFFHTFNALLEGDQQVILTCDRYPKEVNGLEERLKSRFGWGLTVSVEPPELETSVAILMSKADAAGVRLPEEVAFFIAKRIRSNIRELEGALAAGDRQRAFHRENHHH